MSNPYAAPVVVLEAPSNLSFFSVGHVAWASFLGSPLAGCMLLAMNYRRLGKGKAATITMALGCLATTVLMVLSFLLPEKFPSMILPAACTFATFQSAKALQGDFLENHFFHGGSKRSGWLATGIALLTVFVLFVVLMGVLFCLPEAWLDEVLAE